MQEEMGVFGRRAFLKFTSAAMAGLASRKVQTQTSEASRVPLPNRSEPSHPVILKSADLHVVLDPRDGLPFEYRFVRIGQRMHGEDLGKPIAVTFCRKSDWSFNTVSSVVATQNVSSSSADFVFHTAEGVRSAVAFAVRYAIEGLTVNITLRDVRESEGYELIEVALPRLATVREEDGPAWLAHGDDGGWVANLKDSIPGSLRPNTFWGNVLATLAIVMIGTGRVICVQETTAFMAGTKLSVMGEAGKRRASLGTVQCHRINGSLCYDLNTGPGTPRNCGNDRTPNLLIEQESSCRL